MAYQPLEKLLPKADHSIYKLVLLASKRATELAEGMPRLVEFPSSQKSATIALDEILQGKVEIKRGDLKEKPADKAKAAESDNKGKKD